MYLLDTVVLSELRKKDRNQGVTSWIAGRSDSELFISVISVGEIVRGIAMQTAKDPDFAKRLQHWLDRLLFVYKDRILHINVPVAKRWGELSTQVGNSGADILLAATALEYNLCVITRNERHFEPTGTRVLNPWA